MFKRDAIKHLSHKIAYYKEIGEEWADSVNVDALEIAVRAMAEGRIKGKWELMYDRIGLHYICSCCGEWKYHQEQNYCGHCGADMREEKADETN